MTKQSVLAKFDSLNVWKSGDQRAPHKPLLVLLKLLDVHGALDDLPALSLEDTPEQQTHALCATGTDNRHASSLAPNLAPTRCKLSTQRSTPDKMVEKSGEGKNAPAIVVSLEKVNRKEPLSIADNGSRKSA